MASPPTTGPRPGTTGAPTRRALLRLGLVGGAVLASAACSAREREAMLDVDPRRVRLDRDQPAAPPRPRSSERERRRLAVLGGAGAALRAYRDADAEVPRPVGRHGGSTDLAGAVAVHEAHRALLGAGPTALSPRFGQVDPDEGGPALPPSARPAAALGAGAAVALDAASAERAADDADEDLALLHARVAAARAAQAAALRGAGTADLPWPGDPAAAGVVEALQVLLAQEHRARWSYGVVLAWSTDRADDAATARADHTGRVEALTALLVRLGATPVGALATYPTDDDGQPVDGPATAAALALRVEDAVTTTTAVVLRAAVADGQDVWLDAAVTALAEAERSRWSWGGAPAPQPGG